MNIPSQKSAYREYIEKSFGDQSLFDAIIFDCDGVLVDSEDSCNRIEVEELNSHGCQISINDYNSRFAGRTTREAFEILAHENNVAFHPGFVKHVEKKTLAILEKEAMCVPGVRETLEKLNMPKAVASNAYNEKLLSLLRVNNLTAYFNGHIYSADLVDHPKPQPDIYELCAREMGVKPNKCLVIEDSEAGVKAAKAAGMHVFGFLGCHHSDRSYAYVLENAGVEIIFNDMSALPELVARYNP
jgi:HAD superfamily hydrolase (TIGR01509 family)